MKLKNIFIPEDMHTLLKLFALEQKSNVTTITQLAIKEYMENHKTDSSTLPTPIIGATKGRPRSKPTYKPCALEVQMMDIPNVELYPTCLLQPAEKLDTIYIEFRTEHGVIWPTTTETTVLLDIALHSHHLPTEHLGLLDKFHGMPALLVVNRDYTPANDLAKMILELSPGRETFSKYLLQLFAIAGFTITYTNS